jgi:hypothetical protein
MTDHELVERFEACTLEDFHHADHVRVAWIMLRELPLDAAATRFITSLKRFAAAAGAPQKYDDAITRRYILLIHRRMETTEAAAWDEFAGANADLLTWPPSSYEALR